MEIVVDDILIRVLGMLHPEDVLSIRQTSKRLKAITHLRTIWQDQFRFEVLCKGLPVPGTAIPLQKMSALDLEWRTRLAVQVQKMWTRPVCPLRPVLHRSIPAAYQVALRNGGRELLTLHTGRFIIWNLEDVKELAAKNIIREHCLGSHTVWKIHKDHGRLGATAIADSSGKDVFIFKGSLGGSPLRRQYRGRVLGLLNQFILTSTHPESGGDIYIYNWTSTSFGYITIRAEPFFFGDVITFTEFDSRLLVLRETCLEIYPVPTLPEKGRSTILKPVQAFLLPFPVQFPVACSPCTPSELPNGDLALPSKSKHAKTLSESICYQIAGTREVRGCILTRNTASEAKDAPYFRLDSNPFTTVKDCACIRVGHSGRGVWLDSRNNVYRCNTVSMVTPGGGEYPTLDVGLQGSMPLCTLPGILKDQQGDLSLDFDEGMGRIVYCDEAGLVSVVDVV